MLLISEEKLFSLIVNLNKTIIAAFILRQLSDTRTTKLNGEPIMYFFRDSSKFFGTLCMGYLILSVLRVPPENIQQIRA